MKSVDNPKKVKPAKPDKAGKLSKSPTVTHRKEKYDNTPPAEDPATPEELRDGFKRLPAGKLSDRKKDA